MNYFKKSLVTTVYFIALFLCYQPSLNAIPSPVSATTESYVEEKTPHHTIEHHLTKDYLFGIPFLITDKAISHYSPKIVGSDPDTQIMLDLWAVSDAAFGTNGSPKVNIALEEPAKTTLTWQGKIITSSLLVALYCTIIYYTHDPLKPERIVPLIITF